MAIGFIPEPLPVEHCYKAHKLKVQFYHEDSVSGEIV